MGWGTSQGAGGRKRLSLIQMILLTHLKAVFGKRASMVVPDYSLMMAS